MALRIYLESKGVGSSSIPMWGHLYLVIRDDSFTETQADLTTAVIRGGPSGGNLAIQAGILLVESLDSYELGTPREVRPSLDITDLIPDGATAWASLVNTAKDLVGLYDYGFPSAANDREHVSNSNATILTVLNSVGIDVRDLITQGDWFQGFPGATAENGTLLGVGTNEWIDASISMTGDTVLYGRDDFADKMRGTEGDDYFYGRSGNDTVYWTNGNDVIYGDEGVDAYNLDEATAPIDLVLFSSQFLGDYQIDAGLQVGSSQTTIYSVENFALGSGSDTVWLSGSTSSLIQVQNITSLVVDAGESGVEGDTFILETDLGITIDLANNYVQLETVQFSVLGFENVIGSGYDDTITGNSSNNILVGGEGADHIDGGAGDDILVIDADDIDLANGLAPMGGDGWDIVYVTGSVGVELDFDLFGIEAAVGSAGSDIFHVNGTNGFETSVAGGAGDDIFNVTQSQGLSVLWGGAGQDTFNLDSGGNILTATVVGLTSESFSQFNRDMLGLGENFNWSEIDAIILNADSDDLFTMNGNAIEVGEVSEDIIWRIGSDDISFDPYSYVGTTIVNYGPFPLNRLVSDFQVNFLDTTGSSLTTVQSGAVRVSTEFITVHKDSGGSEWIFAEQYDFEDIVDLSSANYTSSWVDVGGGQQERVVGWLTFSAHRGHLPKS